MATATVVATERSAPRDPGAVLAVSETGEVAGSVTGGCVEPAVYEEARDVLAGGAPRLLTYGIADEEAFEVGLSCGGTVHIFVDMLDATLLRELANAVRAERPVGLSVTVEGPRLGAKHLTDATSATGLVGWRASARSSCRSRLRRACTSSAPSTTPRPLRASALPRLPRHRVRRAGAVRHGRAVPRRRRARGRLARHFLAGAPVDERSAIVVLTHDHKFDVPLLQVALRTKAGYVGAMAAARPPREREAKLGRPA